jgi:hypothetical protein
MPRYFFHTVDGTHDIDHLGHELVDDAAARREAVRYASALLADNPAMPLEDDALRINVTDEAGHLSCSVIILAVDANWSSDDAIERLAQSAPKFSQ